MKQRAILTADVVDSRMKSPTARKDLYQGIKVFLTQSKKEKLIDGYHVYGGDSFQAVVEDRERALRAALLIRSYIISFQGKEENKQALPEISNKGYFSARNDVRIGIGIGEVDFLNKNALAQSDGPAFHYSGEMLEKLKGQASRIMVKTPDSRFNELMEAPILLLDAVIQKWTVNQAQVVYHKLKKDPDEEIAEKLNISQSAVSQRSKTSNWYAIERMLEHFSKEVSSI